MAIKEQLEITPELIEAVRLIMPTDARMSGYSRVTDPELLAAVRLMSQQLGLPKEPTLIYANRGDSIIGGGVLETREGNHFITLARGLSSRDSIAVIAHELGHIKNGDTSPEGILRRDNSAARHAAERRADSIATILCQGDQVADFLEKHSRFDPDPHSHPDTHGRVNFLRQAGEIERVGGRCPPLRGVSGGEDVNQHGAPHRGARPTSPRQR